MRTGNVGVMATLVGMSMVMQGCSSSGWLPRWPWEDGDDWQKWPWPKGNSTAGWPWTAPEDKGKGKGGGGDE
eukprot:CAMPEP_0204495700 /NCGR_PEP_ID=MMETSP0471-20130131/87058_1 /ASSEMBLY_ACC=CAM_ASM_000602 /TAXON_ID=2969 /ORGANISM="Oxyrrhis marina" /LENGTH=71 /DNA_ID=CAMNT_0051499979 /DNA_START=99 /DNA_END=311 /DNA_ORIENTATION=-